MFIDIFDVIKKYIIYCIIVILIPSIYAYVQFNAVDYGSYRDLLGLLSYGVVVICFYTLFSYLLYFLHLSYEERYLFIWFKKVLPICIFCTIYFSVYYNNDFFSTNILQKLKDVITICIIAYIMW